MIDGVLGDGCWEDFSHTGVAEDFARLTENVPAPISTRVSFTHDDVNLYIAVDCEEPHTDRLEREPSGGSVNYQREEVIEFRFNAPGQGTFFNQLMVTPSGKQRHCWFSVEEGGGRELDHIDWAAQTSVVPGHWYVELAVPFKALGTDSPKDGEQWQMNVLRFRHMDGSDVWPDRALWEEASCWSCPDRPRRRLAPPGAKALRCRIRTRSSC